MPRPDPRVEPESDSETSTPQVSVERVVVSKIEVPKIDVEEEEGAAPSSQRSVTVKSEDPRVAEIEPLVERNDWTAVVAKLGSVEDAGKLPPNLGLIVAIAHNELANDGSVEARNTAVRSMAALMNLPAENELARVLARRLLRKNQTGFRHRPAPPPKTSLFIAAIVVALGGALGWFLSSPMGTRLLHQLVR
jgi:hypothetical protein